MIYQIMFIQPSSNKDTPTIVLPFVLQESTFGMYLLTSLAIIPFHLISQIIIIIFDTGC